jgi:hypothetical protein
MWYDSAIDNETASQVMEHLEAWPTEERVSTVDEIRISPATVSTPHPAKLPTLTPNKQSATAPSVLRGGYSWAL